MQIKDSVFIVTGGASGLGGAVAELFAELGGKVVIADLNAETGEAQAKKIGDSARFVKADVSDEASVNKVVAEAQSAFGGLQGVINCAGIGVAMKVVGREGVIHPLDVFAKVIGVNLVGTFNVIRLASKVMMEGEPNDEGERGVIINTASVAAFDGQIGQAAYSASKGGVVGMTLPIAREMARSGIRVCTVAPGIFDTPMMEGLPEAARELLGQQVPFPSRLGRPEEFAALVRHIVENTMLNGEVIRLDGAIRMAPR